jgi:monoamine oxidase
MKSLYLIAIKDYYWSVGTHYYAPLKGFRTREDFVRRAQHPIQNMLVVGEVVSRYQGWVEGALESVETGLTKQWIQHNNCF